MQLQVIDIRPALTGNLAGRPVESLHIDSIEGGRHPDRDDPRARDAVVAPDGEPILPPSA